MAEAPQLGSLKKILVASDLSPRADHAVVRAVQLAQEQHAGLTVLHVLDRGLADDAQVVNTVEQELRQRVETLTPVPDGTMTTRVVTGTPYVEIIRRAREEVADLTIVGAHGAQFLKDMFFGATAEKIVRNGDRSVLVVKQPLDGPYHRVLVAVDFSPASRQALELALRLAPDARCHVLHVYQGIEGQLRRGSPTEAELIRYRRQRAREARKELEGFLHGCASSTKQMKRLVKDGHPFYVISQTAKRLRVDLLAVGTIGRTGLPYLLLGSVAERVLREARCDVLIVRSGPVHFELP
jgi:nucleotide-binding universal stress UspA family protein